MRPRRQAGAVAAAHRHDRRDAARRGRGGRRRRAEHLAGRARARSRARDWTVEPDLSNAAVFLAAAAVTGGEVTVAGWPERSTQPGDGILPVLERVGRHGRARSGGMTVRGPDTLAGVDVDLHDVGELTPTVAAVAALAATARRGCAGSRTCAATRRTAWPRSPPRSPRWAATSRRPHDGLVIRPAPLHAGDRPWRAYADHRMATAGALIGLVVPGVLIDDVACTAKTIPDFPGRWAALVEA